MIFISSAIEFEDLNAYHPAAGSFFLAVSHRPKHRTLSRPEQPFPRVGQICCDDSSGGIMRRLLVALLLVLLALSANPAVGPASSAVAGKIASDPPAVAPEAVGLASSRLATIRS